MGKAKSVIGSKCRVKSDHGIFAIPSKEDATVSVEKFCDSYGVDKDAFSRMTGFSSRAVVNCSSGKPPGRSTQKKITELTRLFDALCDLVVPKAIGPWLKTSNSAFAGSTPL
jgi:hypothetical protein